MSLDTEWFLVSIICQAFVGFIYPDRLMKGYITRYTFAKFIKTRLPQMDSLLRLLFIIWISYAAEYFMNNKVVSICESAVIIIVYLDDYLFGDDRENKRRWNLVKNKIKWKMELPQEVVVND